MKVAGKVFINSRISKIIIIIIIKYRGGNFNGDYRGL